MKTCVAAVALALAAAASAQAREVVALADGLRLELGERELTLRGPGGQPRAALALRAEQLDARGNLAAVLDASTQQALLIRVDGARASLRPLPALPLSSFAVESMCLYRDRQGIDFLFIAARDGQAEQWLIDGEGARLVRRLSMPLDAGQCRVDDATHTLHVDEPGIGTWAYEADSEAMPARTLHKRGARRKPVDGNRAVIVQPRTQTDTVARRGDVADDPAIWVHPTDPASSRILGTNKKQGLLVYDLQGRQQQFLESGRLNNVDVRQGVGFGGEQFDLAVATERDDNVTVLYGIDGAGSVSELARFATGLPEVYGICLFQPRAGGLEVIVNDKSGLFRQFRISRTGTTWTAAVTRQFKVASQPEGCVADDSNERLFIGEEKRGVWTLAARSDAPARLSKVLGVGPDLRADVEGMAIYHGYKEPLLVVSSQGDNSYVVLNATAPYKVRGRFKVGFNVAEGIDGTSDTDGLDVTARDLGGPYRQGMLVIQDGYKRLPDGTQNFKYVSWEDVARALTLE